MINYTRRFRFIINLHYLVYYRTLLESDALNCLQWDPADFHNEEEFLSKLKESPVDFIIALHAYRAGQFLSDKGDYMCIYLDCMYSFMQQFIICGKTDRQTDGYRDKKNVQKNCLWNTLSQIQFPGANIYIYIPGTYCMLVCLGRIGNC